MVSAEHNDPDTGYSDPPGTRALLKGSAALVVAVLVGLGAFVLAAFGIVPALVLLFAAVPLGVWGVKKLRRNERQIRPEAQRPQPLTGD